jgi:hypothetical protein
MEDTAISFMRGMENADPLGAPSGDTSRKRR